MNSHTNRLSRRTILRVGLSIPPVMLAACAAPIVTSPAAGPAAEAPAPAAVEPVALPTVTPEADAERIAEALPPTPACDDGDDEPTLAQTEGPYYTPNTPQRSSFIEAGVTGAPMRVQGLVLSTGCLPVAAALLDFWHCDDAGVYDNVGYRLRGHFFTDEAGRYSLETIMPGLYPGRTRHFHVKVQAPNQPVLTTQLYFPNEPANGRDGIYRPELLMDIQDGSSGKVGTFNFVLQLG